jgi:hypothetical protein
MREWTRRYLKVWGLERVRDASPEVEGRTLTYGLRPLDCDHGEGGAPLGLQKDVPCRRRSFIEMSTRIVTGFKRKVILQNLRSAGEGAKDSPDMALARTNPNRSMLSHITFPLRPRPRFQAAEMRARPVTTQYPAVSPIVPQNRALQSP